MASLSGSNLPKRTRIRKRQINSDPCGKFHNRKFGPRLTVFLNGAGWTAARRAGERREEAGPVSTAPLLSPALCAPMWGALTPTSSDTGGPVILSSSTPAPIATSGIRSVDPEPLASQKNRQPSLAIFPVPELIIFFH